MHGEIVARHTKLVERRVATLERLNLLSVSTCFACQTSEDRSKRFQEVTSGLSNLPNAFAWQRTHPIEPTKLFD